MSVNATIEAENSFSEVFSPIIGKFQASASARSKITLQAQVGAIGWVTVATFHAVDTGAVNNIGGYSATDTVMLTSGLTGNWAIGQWFIVAGDTVLHRVTDFTLGTSVTFTPGLGSDVIDTAVITRVIASASGISVQEQVDDETLWRIGVATGDFAMVAPVRLGQA